MNCAECQELLVAYLEGLLEDSEKQLVAGHVKDCVGCRTELEGLGTLQRRLVNNGEALAQGSIEDDVMNRIIREQSARLKAAAQAGTGLQRRRLTMKSSMVRIAVAAVVVLAVAGGLFLWTGTKSGVALADVLAKMEQVQAFMYKATMHVKGTTPGMPAGGVNMEMSMLMSNEYGMRMDMTSADPKFGQAVTQQIYMLPQQKVMMTLVPASKKYVRMELDDSMFEQMKKKNNDPRVMVRQVLDCKYEELGKSVIDGVEVEGFQTTDPAYMGSGLGAVDVKIWVDLKSGLPVCMEMKIKMNEQMEMEGTLHDFQWDVPVGAAEFSPVIPTDFTAGPGDGFKVPAMTEETAVVGLKLCGELSGKYPDDLNMITLMRVVTEGSKAELTPAPQEPSQPRDQATSADDQVKKMMDKMMPVQMLAAFHMRLVQEKKEPAYYGKVVKPGDAAQVLLRWKTADNEYRVIFGDLHAITADADTLAKLEAALPK